MSGGGIVSRSSVLRRSLLARRSPVVIAALASALASALLIVGSGAGPAGASSTSITLYSGQHVQTTQALVAAFEKKTSITVNTRYDDEDTFVDQIQTEGKNSPADVFFTENSPPLEELATKGLLSSVDSSTLAQTPAKYDATNGKWAGISARVSVMVYNPSLIKASQLPTSAMQLANPQWKGKIALAGAETDFQPIVTSVARTYGDAAALKWLKALKTNAGGHLYPDNETIADEVNRGQVALGIMNQYYWYRERSEVGASNMHSKIAYFAPHDVGYVARRLGGGHPQVVEAPGGRSEIRGLPDLEAQGRTSSSIARVGNIRSTPA